MHLRKVGRLAYVGLALAPRLPAAADSLLRQPDIHSVLAQRFDRLRLQEVVDLLAPALPVPATSLLRS